MQVIIFSKALKDHTTAEALIISAEIRYEGIELNNRYLTADVRLKRSMN